MATIKARWARTIQNKPYEPETFELSVEDTITTTDIEKVVKISTQLERRLAAEGDAIVRERLKVINGVVDTGPVEPDPFMPKR